MNRGSKWYQLRENRRPRRQCYQPLQNDEEIENEIVDGTENLINLTSTRPDLYVEKILEPGDTLRSLSLQFNCPVAELKRINHILRDNEVFARRKIKVPIKPGSLLTEQLARVHSTNGVQNGVSNGCSESASTSSTDVETENIPATKLNFNKSTTQLLQDSFLLKSFSSENEIFNCKSVTNTSFIPVSKENTIYEINTSNVLLQDDKQENKLHLNSENQPFKCSGADWGLSWLHLVICVLLLGCVGPFFYIYLTEKKHSS